MARPKLELVVDGRVVRATTLVELRRVLRRRAKATEFHLHEEDGRSVTMLASGTRAWVMFLREPGAHQHVVSPARPLSCARR